MRIPRLTFALATLLGCATSTAAPPDTAPPAAEYRGVPGFDTRDYPGEETMRRWREASPYRWVAVYLPAPCHPRRSWVGSRAALAAMGWGTEAVYVGEQDWPAAAGDTVPSDPTRRCTRRNLTAERGAADGAEAHAAAAAEGFPAGAPLFLDVEPVDSVSPALAAYVRGWTAGVLAAGAYVPSLYAHARNARALQRIVQEELARAGSAERPRLWVASAAGFDLRKAPSESGFPEADIWQGRFDVTERWGGVALRIDVDVARREDAGGR